ncbi:uncharacterized protein EI90DRAFT_3144449 [Cantharellus anzutake]|uniref:uncharacterized protein n=1 Tax=Cantharellus anzutake TaxID=1750568 RepID=UPI0019079DD9|nr:uncharacterized protein EI90DRAFT_3144449 [Cantharellus anzutake]KAF8337359.1 hypothetical protein EI90DRAFT_3144449 [Cantharellus anzutake]
MAASDAATTTLSRQFSFFNLSSVKDVNDAASSPEVVRSPSEISVTASSSVGILIADIYGLVHILDRTWVKLHSWQAFLNGRVTHMAESRGILVSIGEEESRIPQLKVWDITHKDKKTGKPTLLRSAKVPLGPKPFPVSTIAISPSLSHLAVGVSDGTVLFYRHLDQSLFSGALSLSALPKPKVIHENSNEPITGLAFRSSPPSSAADGSGKELLHLFIVTTNRILSYLVLGKGSGGVPVLVDDIGCGLGCAAINEKLGEMAVARDEAIYMCTPAGRGACYAVEWPKSLVRSFRNYLVMVSPPFFPTGASTPATVRNYVARAAIPTVAPQTDVSKVIVYNLENKFTAYSESAFIEGVRDVVCDSDSVYIIGNDGKLFRLEEKPTVQKLAILFSKSQYLLAISLAQSEGMDEEGVASIRKQYGDHLYLKGNYDEAINQFIKTLGHVQPSYVIRKFLDAQQIHNLASYLQELHACGLASSDHTTLLLNTYTKLRDTECLSQFIKMDSLPKQQPGDAGSGDTTSRFELPFDLDTAIRVCRQAGYFEHAGFLAKKYSRHDDYLRIQIDDAGNFEDALVYLKELSIDASENLLRYGRILLSNLPEDTMQFLVDICAGPAPEQLTETPSGAAPNGTSHQRASSGIPFLPYLTLNRSTGTDNVAAGQFSSPHPASHIHPGTHDQADVQQLSSDISGPSAPAQAKGSNPIIQRPSPSQFFAHFVQHPDYFIRFLEAVAFRKWNKRVDLEHTITQSGRVPNPGEDAQSQTAVWNTLLELYLSAASEADSGSDSKNGTLLRKKAMHVLENDDQFLYDPTHALIVCSTHSFTEGLVLLWEKMGMYEDVLRFWMDRANSPDKIDSNDPSAVDASSRVINYLTLYGPQHAHLYSLVLRFLTSSPALLSRHSADIKNILDYIEQEKILPPIVVIQVLSRNDVASVGLVKQWLMTRIAETREEIDAATKLQEIAELSDAENPRIFHVTRCSACGGQLDLPSVHFMCNHSYHQRCLSDHDTECPNCAKNHSLIREIRRDNEEFAKQPDLFYYNVDSQGFAAIASAFSKGIIARVPTEGEMHSMLT